MTNVHMKLRWWASNARNYAAAGVVVVDDTVEVLIVVVQVAVLVIEMSWLTVGEVIVGMSAGETQ